MTLPPFAPLAISVLVALAGRLATRGRLAWRPAAASVALMAGWAALAATPRSWWSPRLVADHLPGAALAIALGAVAATRLHGRAQSWANFAASAAASWWVAGAPAARPEFWRTWFATMALAWLLRRLGATAGPAALAFAATLAAGLFAAGPFPVETMAALVLCGVALTTLRDTAALPAMALSVMLVATELGAGRLMRGTVGMVELVCLAAIAAAALRPWAGRTLQYRLGRLGRLAEIAAPVALAAAGAAFAWVGARALRG